MISGTPSITTPRSRATADTSAAINFAIAHFHDIRNVALRGTVLFTRVRTTVLCLFFPTSEPYRILTSHILTAQNSLCGSNFNGLYAA
ncbi:hypothetical protein WN55_00090 [Dufourea novaeangliae]|uniref:Uncharacterized protein n=1 Tax=Dufourea novaeangliae TaxID=178035 RepID=A0A154NYF7_DUFNO|nr:hypothetical protein WN55_00090 [Dufourea novaeangliae]